MTTLAVFSLSKTGRGKRIWLGIAVALVFIFAFGIRFFTFFLQHWQGDQSQYVALAMKYSSLGLEGLNLYQVEIRNETYAKYPGWQFIYPVLLRESVDGDFVRAYKKFGLEFNNLPLYHKSPLFPVALAVSHNLFSGPGQPFVVLNTDADHEPSRISMNIHFFKAQFWAVIVPLASSLLMILLTFFFGRFLFGSRAALYAMLLMAIHPIDIVNSCKILSDDFVSFFVIASLFLFLFSYRKKSLFYTFLSGLIGGFAVLAKQSALLIFPAVALYLLFTGDHKWYLPRAWLAFFRNKYIWCYFLAAILISGHWFLRVYGVYGNPVYQPDANRILKEDLSGWFGLLSHRPHALILFLYNLPMLCPAFVFGHLTFQYFLRELLANGPDNKVRHALLFLWFWILPFVVFFAFRIESREERYLIPIYPALAMLSGYGVSAFQERISKYFSKPILGWIFVIALLVPTVAWSVPIGCETVFKQRFLILEPMKLVDIFYNTAFQFIGCVP